MQFGFRFFSHWPLWALQALGHAIGWLAWLLSPVYRRRFMENARQAGFGFWQVAPAIGHAGAMSSELPRLWLGAPVPVHWADDRALLQACEDPARGVLILTPHLGCFEVAAQASASRMGGAGHGPMTGLYRPARQPGLAKVMETARNRPDLEPVPTTMAGVRQMIKALRAGRSAFLLPDQVPPEGMGSWAPFFGKPAYTMTLAARLVAQTGACVVLVWCERLSWGRGYRMHARALGHELSSDPDVAVVQINQAMERLVCERPDQYLWGYARYKAPRGT